MNPFFRFPNDRLTGSPATNFAFWPKTHLQPSSGAGYVYFRSENRTYATKGFPTLTYGAMVDGRVSSLPWLNADSYQIRSCGPDGAWYSGRTNAGVAYWGSKVGFSEPFDPNYPAAREADDMGNGWEGSLGDNL